MNGDSLLLDTNIVLYLLSGDETLIPLLEDKQLYLSFITEIELLSFSEVTEKESNAIKRFVKECVIIDTPNEVKEVAVSIRRKRIVKLPDAIIAATAVFLNVPLVTADNGFKRIKEADIILYKK